MAPFLPFAMYFYVSALCQVVGEIAQFLALTASDMVSMLFKTKKISHRQESMDQIGLDGREHLALYDDGVRLVLLGGHQAAEPRSLRQLRRRRLHGRSRRHGFFGYCNGFFYFKDFSCLSS